MLSHVAFEQIRDNYWFGGYGPFKVVIDKSNGYINATKLCSAGGKEYKEWSRLKGSHQLIETLKNNMVLDSIHGAFGSSLQDQGEQICSPSALPCILLNSGSSDEVSRLISGTYCHPDLIPHIACWVSPTFAIQVSRIINYYLVEDYQYRLQQSELAATELLQSLEASHEVTTTTQLALEAAQVENTRLQDEVNTNTTLINIKQEVMENLQDAVCEKIRERQVWSSTHAFTLLKLHDEKARHPFYIIRCQGRRMSGAISKLRRKFTSAEVVYQQRKVPNAINLYSRLKEQKLVEHTHNFCSPTCSQQQLLYHLNSLCGTHYPASNPAPLNGCVKMEDSA
jgi:hypothetical protein